MKNSTTSGNRFGKILISIAFWLLLWQILSLSVGQKLLLCSPVEAAIKLVELAVLKEFWFAILLSLGRIVLGFAIAVIAGIALAALASRFDMVKTLLAPAVFTIKTAPVASFIILLLIWLSSSSLSVVISFMMAMPIVYEGALAGIAEVDNQLIEMADVFRLPLFRRIRYIYLSQIMPYFKTACETSAGLCFKAGIAAEVIAMPSGTIGERLYQAKIYLDTPELFAWTIVVILLSAALTKLVSPLLANLVHRLERM